MKKRIFNSMMLLASATLILSVSCKKDSDDDEVGPKLTGTWETSLYFDGSTDSYDGVYEIEQDDDGDLDGTFEFSDGSGATTLSSGSEIDGNNVTLKWTLTDGATSMPLTFEGEVNSAFDEMDGNWYYMGLKLGTWIAEKTDDKAASVVIRKEKQADLMIEKLLKNSREK